MVLPSTNALNKQIKQSNDVKMTIQLSFEDQCHIKRLTDQLTNLLKGKKVHHLNEDAKLLVRQLEEQRRKILQNAMIEQQKQMEIVNRTV